MLDKHYEAGSQLYAVRHSNSLGSKLHVNWLNKRSFFDSIYTRYLSKKYYGDFRSFTGTEVWVCGVTRSFINRW